MRKVVKLFLLAENRLLREALIRSLSTKSELRIVGASAYSPSVCQEIIAARPQIILLDSSGPPVSRSALICDLRSAIRNLSIVMVDMEPEEEVFLSAIRSGVVGYVLKDASAVDVATAIGEVAAGNVVCPPSLSLLLFRLIRQQALIQSTIAWASELGLSRREHEIADLLCERLTNKEIAQQLYLSEQTVKNHVHHILQKTGAPNRLSVVDFRQSKRQDGELNDVPGMSGEAGIPKANRLRLEIPQKTPLSEII
jgi:DNA-binding NarL/FixJ family response regulator